MALQDDLKARTSALISQQMANWVVEIQRAIQGHQAALVRALDELGESVARYDEKVDERAIAAAMAEVVARQPSAPAADYSTLKSAIAAVEKGTNLSEVLTHLVTEASRQIDRAAMFIIKSNAAVGWYGRGFDHPEAVKTLSIPLTADTLFRVVNSSRHATRGHVTHSPGTTQALARLGGEPQGILAVPLILRDKVAAVLYCDTPQDEVPQGVADAIEILVSFAGKVIDVLSGTPRPAAASATSPGVSVGTNPPLRAPTPAPAAGAPPLAVASDAGGTSTVMWAPGAGSRPAPAPARPAPPPAPGPPSARPFVPPAPVAPPAAPAARVPPQDQKAHDDAKRFARLVVSEIKLYNEAKVSEGRRTKDIYERLKEDIERGRQMYQDRVAPQVRDTTDYFQDELVRILAGGDATALGPM
ncbi:MAG: hypothetical protein ACM3PV_14435 [Betaproteobacteria bacterium]